MHEHRRRVSHASLAGLLRPASAVDMRKVNGRDIPISRVVQACGNVIEALNILVALEFCRRCAGGCSGGNES